MAHARKRGAKWRGDVPKLVSRILLKIRERARSAADSVTEVSTDDIFRGDDGILWLFTQLDARVLRSQDRGASEGAVMRALIEAINRGLIERPDCARLTTRHYGKSFKVKCRRASCNTVAQRSIVMRAEPYETLGQSGVTPSNCSCGHELTVTAVEPEYDDDSRLGGRLLVLYAADAQVQESVTTTRAYELITRSHTGAWAIYGTLQRMSPGPTPLLLPVNPYELGCKERAGSHHDDVQYGA